MHCHTFIAVSTLLAACRLASSLDVAIIGGGMSGASCAYYLSELFHDDVTITLVEAEGRLGGRVRETKVGSGKYEAGASIIHPSNRLMHHFQTVLGLQKRDAEPSMSMGFFDGEHFSLKTSDWSYVKLGQMLWRYGYDLVRLNSMIGKLVADFSRIYSHQKSGYSFATVESLIGSMSEALRDAMDLRFDRFLQQQGFSARFIDEFANVAVRVNYGQNVADMHALVGCVSLAAAQPGLSAVKGGNARVAEGLIKKSRAAVKLGTRVETIERLSSGKFRLTLRDLNSNEVEKSGEFDSVVLAAPQIEESDIKFEGFGDELRSNLGPYHRTVSTFVSGTPAPEAFHLSAPSEVPDMVFSTNASLFYASLARNFAVDHKKQGFISNLLPTPSGSTQKESVFKVFSSKPLSNAQSEFLFRRQLAEKRVDFRHAYPEYKRRAELRKPWYFELAPDLYHTSVIEWASSAMETAAIGGRNVALLIYNRRKKLDDRIDPFGPEDNERGRDEL